MGLGTIPKVMLFDTGTARGADIRAALDRQGVRCKCWNLSTCETPKIPRWIDAAMLVCDGPTDPDQIDALLERLKSGNIATLMWGGERGGHEGPINHISDQASLDEVLGRLEMITRYAPQVRRLDREVQHLQKLSHQVTRYFEEVDKELQLAGALQRDFMPKQLPEIHPLRFARLFRPACAVSGDIYDVFRIDEAHMGMFVADAMGHGTAAGLMTMFLRQALNPKNVTDDGYHVVSPAEAIGGLHAELARQDLPHFHFITSAYAVCNLRTRQFTMARGGHPYPILIAADGTPRELQPEGPLLGLPDLEPDFEEYTVTLEPGEKIFFYTDGIEEQIVTERDEDAGTTIFTPDFRDWARRDAHGLIGALEDFLDHREGSLHPDDDVTALVMEVLPDGEGSPGAREPGS